MLPVNTTIYLSHQVWTFLNINMFMSLHLCINSNFLLMRLSSLLIELIIHNFSVKHNLHILILP